MLLDLALYGLSRLDFARNTMKSVIKIIFCTNDGFDFFDGFENDNAKGSLTREQHRASI